jgi:hypothetical protein
VSVRDHDSRLSRKFEDWEVVLGCAQSGVEGYISDDDGMLDNPRVIAVVEQLRMTLVVCAEINHDPIAATGLLLAHLPRVAKRHHSNRAQIWKIHPTEQRPRKIAEFKERIERNSGMRVDDFRLSNEALQERYSGHLSPDAPRSPSVAPSTVAWTMTWAKTFPTISWSLPYGSSSPTPSAMLRRARRSGYEPGPAGVHRRSQTPEIPDEPEAIQDRLVLISRVRTPLRRQPVDPPRVGELAERRHRDRCPPGASSEPSIDVLLRPEEIHGASGEDDVVPPAAGGHEAVEEQALFVQALVPNLEGDRLTAVGAGGLDATVDVERSEDPERVPRTIGVPPALGRAHTVSRGYCRERVRHPKLVARRAQDEGMLGVQPSPGFQRLLRSRGRRHRDLLGGRRTTQVNEQAVGEVANRSVSLVHRPAPP